MAFSQRNSQEVHDGQSYKHNDLYLTLHVPRESEGVHERTDFLRFVLWSHWGWPSLVLSRGHQRPGFKFELCLFLDL